MAHLKLFIFCFFVFMLLDIFWLGFVAKDFYHKEYAQWLRLRADGLSPIWWAALIIYTLLALVMMVFVISDTQ